MRYDVALKEILPLATRFLAGLLGEDPAGIKLLNVEFPSTRKRQPDLVFQTASGKIIHVELQSRNQRHMILRMAGYHLSLEERYPGRYIDQVVLYTGLPGMSMPDSHVSQNGGFRFHCRMIDIREFKGRNLLASDSLQDNLLAVLTEDLKQRDVIRRMLRKIQDCPPKDRDDYLAQLLILSGMRKLEPMVQEEASSMPITLDLMKNTVIRGIAEEAHEKGVERGIEEGIERGLRQGRAATLTLILKGRFGDLPAWAKSKLSKASPERLDRWTENIFKATSLKQALD